MINKELCFCLNSVIIVNTFPVETTTNPRPNLDPCQESFWAFILF